jgi:hypothetical protein
MPSWSDENGRCHFSCDDGPCYQSAIGCPAHAPPPLRPPRPKGKIFWGTARFGVMLVTKRGPRNIPVEISFTQDPDGKTRFFWEVDGYGPGDVTGEQSTFEEAVRAGRLAAEKLLREINK